MLVWYWGYSADDAICLVMLGTFNRSSPVIACFNASICLFHSRESKQKVWGCWYFHVLLNNLRPKSKDYKRAARRDVPSGRDSRLLLHRVCGSHGKMLGRVDIARGREFGDLVTLKSHHLHDVLASKTEGSTKANTSKGSHELNLGSKSTLGQQRWHNLASLRRQRAPIPTFRASTALRSAAPATTPQAAAPSPSAGDPLLSSALAGNIDLGTFNVTADRSG